MYTVNTFEIPAPGQPHLYTYLNNDVEVFGINKEQTQFIEMSMSDWQSCKAYSSQHCKKATKTYDIKYPTCLTALFKGNKIQIKELCQFKLEQKPLRPNLIAAAQELIIINAETLVNQCTTPKGTETTVEEGCHMCIKPKHCNCVYIAQSPLGSVTLAPDVEQCTTLSHNEKVKFLVNLAKMQYLWSEHYIKNLSEQVIEKVNKMPEKAPLPLMSSRDVPRALKTGIIVDLVNRHLHYPTTFMYLVHLTQKRLLPGCPQPYSENLHHAHIHLNEKLN